MSKRRDNIQHRKLKELLDKKNSPGEQAMDDFDKEALEGFSMLSGEEEITDLKEELDRKIVRVFTDKKRSARPLYWFAAAGLLLIIGFSVYFIQTGDAVKSNDLSIHSEPSHSGEALQQSIARETEKNSDLQFKEPAKKEESEGREDKHVEKNRAEKLRKDPAVPEIIKDVAPPAAADAALAEATAVQPQPATKLAEEEKNNETQPGVVLDEMQPENTSREETVTLSDKESSGAKLKRKKVQQAKSAKGRADDQDAKDQSAVAYNAAPSAGAPAVYATGSQAHYMGGETFLNKDLKAKLSAKDLDQKFDAVLFIDKQKKVERVEFIKTYDLTKSQQKDVIAILKSLDKFNITGNPSDTAFISYRLIYRP